MHRIRVIYIYRLSDAAPTPQTQRYTWAGKGDPCSGSYEWSRARAVSRGLMNGPGTRGPVTHEPYCNTHVQRTHMSCVYII